MVVPAPSRTWTSGRLPGAILLLGLLAFAVVRVAGFTREFGNNDVAGIAYEADSILRGDLPHRDTLALKPAGTYYLFAAVFELAGRDLGAVRVALAAWLLLAAAGVHRAASALYGSRVAAALATALFLVSAGHFDLNYSSWLIAPYTWAFAAMVLGLRGGSVRWHLAAGACSTAAFLFKQPAAVLAPLAVTLWLHARRQRQPGATAATFGWWAAGALAAALPPVLYYAARGALGDLLRSTFAWGFYREHVASAEPSGSAILPLAGLVLEQLFDLFPLSVGLFVLTLLGVLWHGRRSLAVPPLFPGLAFLALSLVGGAMSGARFYEHYAIQYLPALAILAAHPAGVTGLAGAAVPRWPRWPALLLAAILLAHEGARLASRPDRVFDYKPPLLPDGSTAARRAGEHIRARTRPDETIYVWGWLAWPVYFWADRHAPLSAYREMGRVTTVNTNLHAGSSQPFRFVPGAAADELVRAFVVRKPAYFVYSPYYVWQSGGGPEPLDDFEALRSLLRRDYVLEATYGNLLVYARRPGRQ